MRTIEELCKLSVAGLRAIALNTGGPSTGNKSQIAGAILAKVSQRPTVPVRVVSVDLGLKNIGVCQVLSRPEAKPEVEKWYLESLPAKITTLQPDFAMQARQLVHRIMQDAPEVILVERQRSRSGGSAQVPPDILKVNVLEGMVHAILCTQWPTMYIESVDPKQLLGYWRAQWSREDDPQPKAAERLKKPTPAQLYTASKKARLALVRKWMEMPDKAPFTVSSEAIMPSTKGKQDDLNDALVQAVTWCQWRENTGLVLDSSQNLLQLSTEWTLPG